MILKSETPGSQSSYSVAAQTPQASSSPLVMECVLFGATVELLELVWAGLSWALQALVRPSVCLCLHHPAGLSSDAWKMQSPSFTAPTFTFFWDLTGVLWQIGAYTARWEVFLVLKPWLKFICDVYSNIMEELQLIVLYCKSQALRASAGSNIKNKEGKYIEKSEEWSVHRKH